MQMKFRRSAGIRVTAAVHRLISEGNGARGRRDWETAATAYAAAVAADPSLGHIWMQLGHALKEAGRADDAMEAYARARAIRPNDGEPAFFIAELHKRRGDLRAAVRDYLAAIRADERETRPLEAIARIMGGASPIDTGILAEAIRPDPSAPARPADPISAGAAALDRVIETAGGAPDADVAVLHSARDVIEGLRDRAQSADGPPIPIVFDVTDLVAHFRNHRLPTGIQRVQIEVVTRAIERPDVDARICCFVDGRETLLDIPAPLFLELSYRSTSGADANAAEWLIVKTRLFLHLFLAEAFVFGRGDILVNLGTSWWIYNYYLLIRNAKRDFGIKYIPFVHDLIPIMATEHCVAGVVEDYVSWLVGVFDHADHFLTNSESTARDLIQVAERLGRRLDPEMVDVVRLDADFRRASRSLEASGLARWGLAPAGYCLLVSTIESRKNHLLALEAWSRLIDTHGADAVPKLVCVGRSGWLNTKFFERLRQDWRLQGSVVIIERASDEELASLYRHCLFTLYPSHYEGWGLPVTESLCYGRVPVVADNSSLPEASDGFGILFESNSPAACVAAIEEVVFDTPAREARERRIAEDFRPRSWGMIAEQIIGAIVATATRDAAPAEPVAAPGYFHPVTLYKGTRLWRGLASGEIFRAGSGWLWPEPGGSRTTADGGRLELRVPTAGGAMRLYLKLRGLDRKQSGFSVAAEGRIVASGELDAGEERWVLTDVPNDAADPVLSLLVRGDTVEEIEMMTGGTLKRHEASIAVLGFAVLDRDDEERRAAFVEAIALGDPARVDAYRNARSAAMPARDAVSAAA